MAEIITGNNPFRSAYQIPDWVFPCPYIKFTGNAAGTIYFFGKG